MKQKNSTCLEHTTAGLVTETKPVFFERTRIEINSEAFTYNVQQFKQIIGSRLLAAVVKSNAYGHGLEHIAQLAQKNNNIDWLCVAQLSEAKILRAIGITKPILVLSTIDVPITKKELETIDFIVGDHATAQKLAQAAAQEQHPARIHVKIDTGLGRIGFLSATFATDILLLKKLSHLHIVGLCTHLASADSPELQTSYTQLAQFAQAREIAEKYEIFPAYVHVANSSATIRLALPEANLFRIGLGLYGHWSSPLVEQEARKLFPNVLLKPILSWKTKIISIKEIPAGTTIGYKQEYIATRPMRIALLPTGYADGYDFRLYKTASVLVHGKSAPLVGRISMNLMTIDVTDIQDADIDSIVTLLGPDPAIKLEQLASQSSETPNVRELLVKTNPMITRTVLD